MTPHSAAKSHSAAVGAGRVADKLPDDLARAVTKRMRAAYHAPSAINHPRVGYPPLPKTTHPRLNPKSPNATAGREFLPPGPSPQSGGCSRFRPAKARFINSTGSRPDSRGVMERPI